MGRSTQRGQPELVFDFYNDEWDDLEDGEGAGLLGGWGNDDLDRLLAGSGGGVDGGRRQGGVMGYGARGGRRKSVGALGKGGEGDPTIVPNSSMFGFLEHLPWKIGGRGVRYRPSAADLQDRPQRKAVVEAEPLIEGSDEEEAIRRHQRKRSDTQGSKSTNNSLSSRGDLFPSEDEDDAVPLDDEFAMVLERRNTGTQSDEAGSGRTRGKRVSGSRASTKTASSRETKRTRSRERRSSVSSGKGASMDTTIYNGLPSMEDLEREEQRVRLEEEQENEKKRQEAHRLAVKRGLVTNEEGDDAEEVASELPAVAKIPPSGESTNSSQEQDLPPISLRIASSTDSRQADDAETNE